MSKKVVALLGYGSIGKAIVNSIETGLLSERYSLGFLWNRSPDAFSGTNFSPEVKITCTIDEVMACLDEIDLIVECCHPSVLHQYACDIVKKTDLFIASPAAFTSPDFFDRFIDNGSHSYSHRMYIPFGAAIGVRDLIRLDQMELLEKVNIRMKKAPSSIRIPDSSPLAQERLAMAFEQDGDISILKGHVREICSIAPQNTNVMSIYALAASKLGFNKCEAELIANRDLTHHIIELCIETKDKMKIQMQRINPASRGAVTGRATYDSFIRSLYELSGISHNRVIFC